MTSWAARSMEEKALLNPAFCANLLWHASRGHEEEDEGRGMPVEEAFLVLPLVLHRETRSSLPASIRTSLAVWLAQNPLARGRVSSRARLLVPFTREAILVGGSHRLVALSEGRLTSISTLSRVVSRSLRDASDEVRLCSKRARFVGRWFARAGNSRTVLALVGVRP